MGEIWCPNPLEHVTVVDNGDVHLCQCPWIAPVGNVLQSSPWDLWNSLAAQDMRSAAHGGNFGKYCSRCPLVPGPRGFIVDAERPLLARQAPARIGQLKLDYDRTCRLACGTCRRGVTVVDRELVTKIQEVVVNSGLLKRSDSLYVTGAGDPVDSPSLFSLLRSLPNLVDPLLPPRVILHTHGLSLAEKWSQLGETTSFVKEIRVTVDEALTPGETSQDCGLVNRGGRYESLVNNLYFAGGLGPNVVLRLYYVVQANNFEGMKRALDLAKRVGAASIDFFPLENWGTYQTLDYLVRAVHHSKHPRHLELLAVLREVRTMDTAGLSGGTIFQLDELKGSVKP